VKVNSRIGRSAQPGKPERELIRSTIIEQHGLEADVNTVVAGLGEEVIILAGARQLVEIDTKFNGQLSTQPTEVSMVPNEHMLSIRRV
jgi:hypothetical protein